MKKVEATVLATCLLFVTIRWLGVDASSLRRVVWRLGVVAGDFGNEAGGQGRVMQVLVLGSGRSRDAGRRTHVGRAVVVLGFLFGQFVG